MDNHIEKIISGPQYNPLIIDIEAPPEDEDQKLGENVKFLRHEIRFSKVYLHKPYHQETNGSITPIFPNEARLRSLTYQSELFSDISHVVKTLDENHEEIEEYASVNIVKNRIGAIPIMLGSNICVLSDISKMSYKSISEDPVDPGGYFIINGGEKVVIAQERMNDNHIYLYHNKNGKYPYTCENRSSRDNFSIVYATLIKWDRNDQIYITVKPGWSREDIPIFILFRALGVLSDEDIIELITHSRDKDTMIQLLKKTILYDQTANSKNKKFPIMLTQEAALEYISERSIPAHLRKKDKEYKIKYIMRIIRTNLLPHIDDDFKIKASIFRLYG